MSKYRKWIYITMILAAVLAFVGVALMNTNMAIAFIILIAAIIPAYISHVLDRLEEDERRY